MDIRVLQNRNVIRIAYEKDGTQYENYATTLNFEFPEYVDKDGQQIATDTLNKYIVFNIDENENEDLIIDNKYILKSNITQYGTVKTCIYLKEPSLNDDMSDKLIWISDIFVLDFNKSIEEKNVITQEKIDAFNTLYTELNLRIAEVNDLKIWIEQFQQDVAKGKYDGKDGEDGKTPEKGVDYFTQSDIDAMESDVLNAIKNSDEFDILILE